MPHRLPRFPLDPIEDHIAHRYLHEHRRPSMTEMAAALGISDRSVSRMRNLGDLELWTADRWAGALGLHPADIWPDWYTAQAEHEIDTAAELAEVA